MATTADPPTARPSGADAQQPGPIGIFDHHLKLLSDSYLSFFQERAKIEETYIDALLRLHRKSKATDVFLDDRSEPSSVRHAWNEVRDNVEREAQTRQAFLATLSTDAISPLSALKEIQDRTRKRIKEDIKDSTSAYLDYAENVLPRYKRNYLKKCQEVEDLKASSVSPTSAQPPHTSFEPASIVSSRSTASSSAVPIVTSPQPLRPLTRRASGHQPQPRNRSPSTSTALQDLAHQGKKQLNQLRTFLDNKGGTVKEGLAGGRSDGAVRTVRAKRDADEADREYRKGVHWLETLRLRRMKILEGGFKSLEIFIQESAETMRTVLANYVDNMMATTTTQTQLTTHARSVVNHISPQKEASSLSSSIPRFLHQTTPRRTLYTNYFVGECNDLIFGVGLVDYTTSRGLHEAEIPKIIRICIYEVEKRGLNSEGIYRVSGRHAIVQDLMHKIEKDEEMFQFSSSDDVFVVASLLKQYLRELPEPVFKFPLEDRVKHTEDLNEHLSNNFLFVRAKMRRLPGVHQATLKAILDHLSRVAAHCERNKMDAKNLAIIFCSVIFGEDELPKNGDLLTMQSWKDSLMEDLIVHANVLFDDRAANSSSPPLPPAPAGEPLPSVGYGSSFTQVATVPPRQNIETPFTQDFTPQLPLRPNHSIHPSRRTNAQLNRNVSGEGGDEAHPRQSFEVEKVPTDTSDAVTAQSEKEHELYVPRQPESVADPTQHLSPPAIQDLGASAPPVPVSPRKPRTPKSPHPALPESTDDSGD